MRNTSDGSTEDNTQTGDRHSKVKGTPLKMVCGPQLTCRLLHKVLAYYYVNIYIYYTLWYIGSFLQYNMIQGIVSELFGLLTARHVSCIRLRGWFGLLHGALGYPYFTHISSTAAVLKFFSEFRKNIIWATVLLKKNKKKKKKDARANAIRWV